MTDDIDKGLRELLRRGDAGAWPTLYAQLGASLHSVARSMTNDRTDAEDAVQQTFLELYRSRDSFARASSPRAYAFTVLHHCALRIRQRRARSAAVELTEEFAGAAVDAGRGEQDPRLAAALAALPDEQRDVLALRIDGELTFAEIGAALGVPEDTVASRHRRALEKLRERLGRNR